MTALGIWALQFTPRVALLEDCVVAEVSASARLFSGMQPLHDLVEAGAMELGARIAWAPTGTAALALVHDASTPEDCDGFRAPLAQWLDRKRLLSTLCFC
ncbi:hypothetical protein M5C96_13430 [Acidovorax sp. GBBC 1281]|uniref:hypothetical protein n=1 Tax=Acidovorax sp. GBBC 1281 TaxID=2940492 RepID=UPI002349ECC5|nr:hypothetical protein [Acidovorax sp. GBBC 1281]WCM95498.1 hypothetical protein M5C96_13430 [Acidovorax sp. GBBC 1281]